MKLALAFLAIAALPLCAQTTYTTGGTTFRAASQCEGAVYTTQGIGSTLTAWSSADGPCRWIGNHASIDVTYYAAANSGGNAGSGATICLYSDGSLVGSCVIGAGDSALHSSSAQWTGLSGTHNYELVNVGTNAAGSIATNGYLNIITQITVNGGTGAISQPAERPLIVAYGDSITGYQSSGIFDARQGDWWQVAAALGISDLHFGEYGALVTGTIKTDASINLANIMSAAPASSYLVANSAGVNDANASVALGSAGVGCTAGTFECDYYGMLGSYWALNPTKVYSRQILPNSYTTGGASLSPNIATYNAGIVAAVNQWNTDNPTKPVCTYPTVGWFDPITGTNPSDHLHPTAASYSKIQNNEIPIFAAPVNGVSFTVTGPGSGFVSAPATFPITLPTGFQWTGTIPVTVASSNGADTVCVGATCGTGTVTVSPALSATPSLSLSPASVGSRTLTVSGLPACWTPPTGVSFTGIANPTNSFASGGNFIR